jgi:hypothetical protein
LYAVTYSHKCDPHLLTYVNGFGQFKQAEGNLFSINGGSVNAAAKRPWIIGESGEELAPPKRTKISEEILTNELNPNNATKTD